ncbi:glycosyl hydrolase [Actinoplanes sp. SE50]|uniref:cellulase family glycosylhydrolase n=1 Tax=unclassified Actinoplanes TaxID=2626549 RepID=UPI00023EC77E|nr:MULTISPECIES: cellulase family glycosylhydrolase [unclassified Actinoplanes]AEV83656.1 putative glycosyl hydrolase [Actinoplanes sp. SE50/110]ATO82200.1 glycosyl hydrolase [Actinoplanes sp. SE50]SLL99607.1 glycosyl hydrolase [Actinoplanes sp. SE50/110]
MSSDRIRALALSCLLTVGALVPAAPALADAGQDGNPGASVTDPDMPTLGSRLDAVRTAKTMNYYPSAAGWTAMWTRFDPIQVDSDLERIAALGGTTVRLVVFPKVFGFPQPDPDYLAELSDIINLAGLHRLTVKLTLFDWWSRYSSVNGSVTWANAVLAPYVDDPRVIAVEVKNEMSPDDAEAIGWARRVIPAIREFAPSMPLTVSVDGHAGPSGLARLKDVLGDDMLNYWDFHYYGPSEQALTEIRRAQEMVAPDPMVIGETGLSTAGSSQGAQAVYLARVFRAAAEAGVGSVAPWTLTDFAPGAIPAGSQVSAQPAQYRFGLFRADGTAKPAAAVVRDAWSGTTPGDDLLDMSFERDSDDSPWQDNLPGAGVATQTDETAHDGIYSVRFSGTGRDPRGLPSLRISPLTPVHGGQTWSASAWAKGLDLTGTTEIALSWFDAQGRWISQDRSLRLPPGTTDWTRLSVGAIAPPDAAALQLHLKSGDNAGAAWFDDVNLTVS